MSYQEVMPETPTVEIDSLAVPVAISVQIIKLTPYLEVQNDVVQYHAATAELLGLMEALEAYRTAAYGERKFWHTLTDSWMRGVVINFLEKHHWNHKDKKELAKQLLNVIHFYPEN